MKFLSILLLFSMLSISATVYSQATKFSLELKDVSIEQVFKEVERNSNFSFLYRIGLIDGNKKVSLTVKDATVETILDQLLEGSGVDYRVLENNLVILMKAGDKALQQIMQSFTVTGTVTDESGEPLPGVNVVVKGTTTGVITGADGRYSINVSGADAVLVFSFVGYASQEIAVGDQRAINVTLGIESRQLEEVVVIGYGVQKKINLTGSVATVSARELEERPQANVQNMIQGKVTGLQIVSNTGQPGRDDGAMVIRGRGSYGSSYAPLVLIDGIIGNFQSIAPEDIESVSVLKDAASAAIYGARAANGVILITTKKGKAEKTQVSYSFNYGLQQATFLGDQITKSSDYMELYNQMADRMGGKNKYTQDMIERYKNPNRDKNLYPDYDWMHETFGMGSLMTHNLGVSGGNEKTTYYVSLGYLGQKGILMEHDYRRLTGFVNLESQVHKRIKIGLTANLFNNKTNEPYYTNEEMIQIIYGERPMTKPYLPDGSGRYSFSSMPETLGGEWHNRNPIWTMKETSRSNENWVAHSNIYSMVDFIKQDKMQLVWTTKAGFRYNDQFIREHYPANSGEGFFYLKESDYLSGGSDEHVYATDFNPEKRVSNSDGRSIYTILYTTLGYTWNITPDHDLSALLGYQEEAYSFRSLYGYREDYPSDAMKELNGGSTVGQSLSGNLSQYALRSTFGRLNYAYRQKYLLEANFRYDATSRIHKDNRWGFFPSFSGAWRISEENFVKNNLNWVDNFKLRASWGKLGNSEIGNYPYQDTYSTTSYIFNGAVQQGVLQTALKDITLEWETTAITDIGIDMSLGNGLFYATFDWYKKVTDGILAQSAIPASVGLSAPTINYGSMENKGIEFEVGHRNRVGDFGYGVNFMASFNKNKVTKLRAPSYGSYIREEGKPYDEHYLYIWDTDTNHGIFQSVEDIAAAPTHPNNPRPGDIRFKDINGDGVINADDRQMVKGLYPRMLYSFTLNFDYKRFDLSAFFQGIEGRKIWTNMHGEDPFVLGSPPEKKFLNAWTPENTNTNVPAIYYNFTYNSIAGLRSTYYLKDASYLRLKNLQIGYNFPKEWIGKIGLDYLRIYFSGENLLTFTDYPSYDPERAGDSRQIQFPHLKTYSIGLNVKF